MLQKRKYEEILVKYQNYKINYQKQVEKLSFYKQVAEQLNATAEKYSDRYEAKIAMEEDKVNSKKRAGQDKIDQAEERLSAEKSRLAALDGQIAEARSAIK